MLLKEIHFSNYRAFRSARLPLQPLTVLIGPNGSGKSSALSAIRAMSQFARGESISVEALVPIGTRDPASAIVKLEAIWDNSGTTRFTLRAGQAVGVQSPNDPLAEAHILRLQTGRLFTLDPNQIAAPVPLTNTLEMHESGTGLPAVLTTLQDKWPERFEAVNEGLRHWLPEFDRILLDTPSAGTRAVILRTALGGHQVPTYKLSAGTLFSLALLTLRHLPDPPAIIGLEEPDYSLHPRLLRQLKDSLVRLTTPSAFGENREPAQVVMSTNSPYLVDLFRDELDSIVVTQKHGLHSTFTRLSDLPNVTDIVKDAALGDAWYSGILGGVPVGS